MSEIEQQAVEPTADPRPPLREQSGFSPPASVLVGCLLGAAGAIVIALGTPVLRLPGGAKLSTGIQLTKLVLGMMILGTGGGMILLRPWSRNAARSLILVGGILLPLYPWGDNPLKLGIFEVLNRAIDWEFAWTLRGMVVLTSTIVFGYLSRPSVERAFEVGGVEAAFEGYVCAGCNTTVETYRKEGCDVCGGPFFEQYRSPGGFCYVREV